MLDNKSDLAALMFLDNFAQDKAVQTDVVTALNGIYPEHPLVKDRWNRINTPQFRTAEGSIAPELEFNLCCCVPARRASASPCPTPA